MGAGVGSGDERAASAVAAALTNPLLEDADISNASGALISVIGNERYALCAHDPCHQPKPLTALAPASPLPLPPFYSAA